MDTAMDRGQPASHIRYITFSLQDTLFGIDILNIREIVPVTQITPVQQAPDLVRGLVNLRGQVLTVLDISILMGLKPLQSGSDSHIIVFKHRNTGFLVDRIGDVITLDPGQAEPVPANIDPKIRHCMDHVIHLESELIMILRAEKIFSFSPQAVQALKGDR